MQSIDHMPDAVRRQIAQPGTGRVFRVSARGNAAMPWLRGLLLLGLVGACHLAGAASGWVAILKGTAAESFQEEDLRMFFDAARQALNSEGPREPVNWANADNGTGGSFLIVGESTGRDGAPCKRIRFSTYAPKYPSKSTTTWTACRAADGRWRLASGK